VRRFVYAASSATYGDNEDLPKIESVIGRALSPYAVTKYVNELYADVFARLYGIETIGLRYFNIFGYRQDPQGAYAAVIPKWFAAFIDCEAVYINGDGETSRDFCFIEDCIQANILAATTENGDALNQIYNVAAGNRTNLNQLFELIRKSVVPNIPEAARVEPAYRDFRAGDIRHSVADVSKIKKFLNYEANFPIQESMQKLAKWYFRQMQ
jgi:UDP-N-acetylglucosamine 4-epimerase